MSGIFLLMFLLFVITMAVIVYFRIKKEVDKKE